MRAAAVLVLAGALVACADYQYPNAPAQTQTVASGDLVAKPYCFGGGYPSVAVTVKAFRSTAHVIRFQPRAIDLGDQWLVVLELEGENGTVVAAPDAATLLVGTGCAPPPCR